MTPLPGSGFGSLVVWARGGVRSAFRSTRFGSRESGKTNAAPEASDGAWSADHV